MDFLRQNTNPELQSRIDPQAIADRVKQEMAEANGNPPVATSPVAATDVVSPPSQTPATPVTPQQPTTQNDSTTSQTPAVEAKAPGEAETPNLEEDSLDDKDFEDLIDPSVTSKEKLSLGESYKNLRVKFKETTKSLREREQELEVSKKRVTDYETGTAIPKVLQDKENKLQELERFKNLVDFKASEEYVENVEKPIQDAQSKLKTLADTYSYPVQDLKEARKNMNEAQFNEFLSQNFDPVGAIEIKGLLENLSGLEGKAKEAESQPEKAFQELRSQAARVREVKEVERVHAVQSSSKKAWVDALTNIRDEGKYTVLIYNDNEEWNNKTVRPLLTQAANEYKKTIETLAEKGIKELPPAVAKAIALGHLYGTMSAVVMEAGSKAMQDAEQIRANTQEMFRFNRPSVGGGSPTSNSGGGPPQAAISPKEAAQAITKQVLATRRA